MSCDTCPELRREIADLQSQVDDLEEDAEEAPDPSIIGDLDELKAFARECAEFACDVEAHRYMTTCRACKAREIL